MRDNRTLKQYLIEYGPYLCGAVDTEQKEQSGASVVVVSGNTHVIHY